MKIALLVGTALLLILILIWQWNGIFYNFHPFSSLPKAENLSKQVGFEVLVPKSLANGFSYIDYARDSSDPMVEIHFQKDSKKINLQERLESLQNKLFPNRNIFEESYKLDNQLVQSSQKLAAVDPANKVDTIKDVSIKNYKAYVYKMAGSGRVELKWDDDKRFMWIIGYDQPLDSDLMALAESLYK